MVVTPSVLYGLSVAALTATDMKRLGATQRKMLRNIVGWVKLPDDDWADMYRRLKNKLRSALQQQSVTEWEQALQERKTKLQEDLAASRKNHLTIQAAAWNPNKVADSKLLEHLGRKRGRPRTTWANF